MYPYICQYVQQYISLGICPTVCLLEHLEVHTCWSGIQMSVCTGICSHTQWLSVDLPLSKAPISLLLASASVVSDHSTLT